MGEGAKRTRILSSVMAVMMIERWGGPRIACCIQPMKSDRFLPVSYFPRGPFACINLPDLWFALAVCLSLPRMGSPCAADAPQTLTQKIAGMERKDGFFPLDWDAKSGQAVSRDPAPRPGLSAPRSAALRPGLERHRPRSRPTGRRPRRPLLPRRRQGAADPAQPDVPLLGHRSRRAPRSDAVLRRVGAVGISHRSRRERPPAGRRDRLLSARCPRRRRAAAADRAGHLQARRHRAARWPWTTPGTFPKTPKSKPC